MKKRIFCLFIAVALLCAGCKERELSTIEQLEHAIGEGRVALSDDGNYYAVNPPYYDPNAPDWENVTMAKSFQITVDPEIEFYSGDDYSLSLSDEKYAPGETMTIMLENKTETTEELFYCYMDMLLEDAWHRISSNIGSNDTGRSLNANSIHTVEATPKLIRHFFTHTTDPETGKDIESLEPLVLKPGTYRIRVGLGYPVKHILCKEFTVE